MLATRKPATGRTTRRCPNRPVPLRRRIAPLWLAGFSVAVMAASQQAGGAAVTLSNPPKTLQASSAAPMLKAPDVNKTMATLCELSAEDLTYGCEETFACGPSLEVACEPVGGGLDVISAGTGLRNLATATIGLRGAPPGSKEVFSILIWGAIGTEQGLEVAGRVVFAGQVLHGRSLGETDEPCWDAPGSSLRYRAYWAEISGLLRDTTNGEYTLEVGGATVADGRDSWSGGIATPIDQGGPMFEGASIVSVIARPDHDPSTRVALHHGPELLVGELTLTHELAKPLGVVSEVRHLRIGADGQLGGYLGPVARYRTEIGDIGGGWTILRGQGSKVDAHADWNGDDGGSNQLWDTEDTRTDGGGLGLDGRSSYGVRYQVESPAPASQVITDCVAVTLHAAVFQ